MKKIPPKKRRGRPPLGPRKPGELGRSPILKVPLKPATLAALEKRAGNEPVAPLARDILEEATGT